MGVDEDTPSLAHALHKAFLLFAPKKFLGYPTRQSLSSESDDINYSWLTYDEVFRKVLNLAASLKLISLLRRSVVGICANNTIEWLLTDFSCSFNDYVTVGLHSSWSDESMLHVLKSSEADCVVCMSCDLLKFLNYSSACTSIQIIIIIEDKKTEVCHLTDRQTIEHFKEHNIDSTVTVYTFEDLLTANFKIRSKLLDGTFTGEIQSSSSCRSDLSSISGAGAEIPSWFGLHKPISPEESDDIYSLMYTSGTTGCPKGVTVTKSRWLVDARSNSFSGQSDPTVVSYMSLAHGGDRGICWQACFAGARIGLVAPSTSDALFLLRNIKAVQPTFLLCMSYLWCEYFALFKRDLEQRVIEYITNSSMVEIEILSHLKLGSLLCSNHKYGSESNVDGVLVDDRLRVCIAAMRQQEEWSTFINASGALLGIKDLLLLEWYDLFGGRVFVPVTGGGHTSEEVLQWMVELFMPPTATLKEQSSRVKNAYGLSEFPGISVNGVISSLIELELVPVPENDVILSAHLSSNTVQSASIPLPFQSDSTDLSIALTTTAAKSTTIKVTCRKGEHFDPSIAITCPESSSTGSGSGSCSYNRCRYRGEIRVRNKDPSLLVSYWKEDEATSAAVRNGWFYTGIRFQFYFNPNFFSFVVVKLCTFRRPRSLQI